MTTALIMMYLFLLITERADDRAAARRLFIRLLSIADDCPAGPS
jgi:hypothetical protein